MIIIGPDAPEDATKLKRAVEKKLMKNFLDFDHERIAKGFSETLMRMLMSGIESILVNHTSNENTKKQINSLLRYHLRGVLAFSTLRNE